MVRDVAAVDCPACIEVLRQERVCPRCRCVDDHSRGCTDVVMYRVTVS
jgi:hypothetical protein